MKLALEFEQEVHRRLLTRDPTALANLAEACANELHAWLRHQVPGIRDPHLYDNAAADAILNHGEHPDKFDPSRSRLFSYLCMSAKGDLLNALKRESGRQQREVSFADSVEDDDSGRNEIIEEPFRRFTGRNEEEDELIRKLDLENARKEFLDSVPEYEIAAVSEWLEGTRETSTFVDLLGFEDLGKDKQEEAVKRFKDRYTQQLKRWVARKQETDGIQ